MPAARSGCVNRSRSRSTSSAPAATASSTASDAERQRAAVRCPLSEQQSERLAAEPTDRELERRSRAGIQPLDVVDREENSAVCRERTERPERCGGDRAPLGRLAAWLLEEE